MSWWRSTTFLIYGMRNFGKKGYEAMRKDKNYEDMNALDLKQKSIMITGANAGLGFAATLWFATHGSTVHMVCRSKERGEKARNDIVERTKNENVHLHLADVSSSADVRGLAKNFMKSGEPLDVLINNAGVLFHEKTAPSKDGVEITLATNMLGGFLLTNLLLPVLMKSPDPRVILVSSGGGLTEKLTIRAAYDKAASAQPYDEALGRSLYALTKRQQIVLAEKYKEKFTKKTGVAFFSMHPGWCDTEGLQTAMPSFYNFMKDRLRTIDEGSDTIQWLAVSPNVDKEKDGGLYFRDRKAEVKHLPLGGTGYSNDQAEDYWNWCCELAQWKEEDLDADIATYEKMLKKASKKAKSSKSSEEEEPAIEETTAKKSKKEKQPTLNEKEEEVGEAKESHEGTEGSKKKKFKSSAKSDE